jgi:hypothetical protein
LADGVNLVAYPGDAGGFSYLDGLCGGASFDFCSVATLECLKEEGSRVLTPNCAAAVAAVVERDPQIDGGSACDDLGPGEGTGVDFCSSIGGCVGGAPNCKAIICNACGAVDGIALGGDGGTFFGGLCPAPSASAPCAVLECLADAGARVVSRECAAALAALAARYLDGGFDAG